MMRKLGKQNMRSNGHKDVGAFTLMDLATAVGVAILLLLVGTASFQEFSYKSKKSACMANLRQLGVAMSLYERDNGGRLPFAYIEYSPSTFVSWDRLTYSYAGSGSGQNRLLQCPSDIIPANGGDPRRTYSMSRHNMDRKNWPPAPGNSTGVGLWWSSRGRRYASVAGLNRTSSVPAISIDLIPAPGTTLLLTEQAQSYNVEFSFSGATIDSPLAHLDTKAVNPDRYHGGRFNYLMVDGHVAFLSPLESLGENDPVYDDPAAKFQNVWTINHN